MPRYELRTDFIEWTQDLRIAFYQGTEIGRSTDGDIRPVLEAIRAHALANGVSLPNETDYQMQTINTRGILLSLEARKTWAEIHYLPMPASDEHSDRDGDGDG